MPAVIGSPPPADPLVQRWLEAYEQLPAGVCVMGRDGRIVGANGLYCRLVGYEAGELLGMRASDLTHPEDRPRDAAAITALLRGEPGMYAVEKRCMRRGGRETWVSCSVSAVRDDAGEVRFALAVMREIDDLKRTEEALRQELEQRRRAESELRRSEARAAALFNQNAAGVAVTDLRGRLLAVNDRYCEILGRTRADLVGMRMHELTHAEDLPSNLPLLQRMVATGESCQMEKRYLRGDGSAVWAHVAVSLVRPEGDADTQVLAVVFDIDARKTAEQELKAADRRKDDFLAMLAHELRNPLAPIGNAAQLLKVAGDDPVRVAKCSEIIGRQVKHMTELVDELLDVSRVTRGVIELQMTPVDLHAVIADAIEQARPLMEEKRHTLATRLSVSPAHVRGDRTRLVQVLSNLLTNAAKYTLREGRIALVMAVREQQAVIEVIDNGSGIDPDFLPHIFDLFTQGERSRDRAQGGLGLGLALVRSLVSLHGGTVAAASRGLAMGSTFTLTLPLCEPAVAPDPAPASPDEAATATGRPRRVLVVDDNLDAAQTLAALLHAAGHDVMVEASPHSALRAAAARPPEVFVLDIGLPGMDGYELARRLKENPTCAGATFIALTGYGQPDDVAQSRAAGFDHHFVKPLDGVRIAELLAAA